MSKASIVQCEICRREFKKRKRKSRFCSLPCYHAWMGRKDNQKIQPASVPDRIRQLLYVTQPYCIMCGTMRERVLQVHHIIPYRLTRDNSLSNLIRVCVRCHRGVEKITRDLLLTVSDYKTTKFVLRNQFNHYRSVTAHTLSVLKCKST